MGQAHGNGSTQVYHGSFCQSCFLPVSSCLQTLKGMLQTPEGTGDETVQSGLQSFGPDEGLSMEIRVLPPRYTVCVHLGPPDLMLLVLPSLGRVWMSWKRKWFEGRRSTGR